MDYPFRVGEKYFTDEQQKHIEEFIKFMPQASRIYENAKGEKRQVLIVRLPRGCITDMTAYFDDGKGQVFYHTPTAKHLEPWAVMAYFDLNDEGKVKSCTSMEWMEWLGDQVKISDAPVTMSDADMALTKHSQAMAKQLAAGGMPATTGDLTEEDKKSWRPNRKKKM